MLAIYSGDTLEIVYFILNYINLRVFLINLVSLQYTHCKNMLRLRKYLYFSCFYTYREIRTVTGFPEVMFELSIRIVIFTILKYMGTCQITFDSMKPFVPVWAVQLFRK